MREKVELVLVVAWPISHELVTFHMRFLLRGPQVAVADLGILGAEGKKA